MYAQLDVIGAAEAASEARALADREPYRPFLEAVERFAAEQGLIASGALANRLLLGKPLDLDSYLLEFHSGQALKHINSVADALYAVDPERLGRYASAMTKLAHVNFTAGTDGRDVCTITALPVHRGIRIADVVIPTYRPGQFTQARLACMGPEVQLIQTYAVLCNPAKAGEWCGLLDTERELRALLSPAKKATGQRRWVAEAFLPFAAGPGRVLIGQVALAALAGRPPTGRLQIFTTVPLEQEGKELVVYARTRRIDLQWSINDPKIPTDPRLRRLTAYINEGRDRREPILDIYHSGELVPYTTLGAVGGRARPGKPPRANKPAASASTFDMASMKIGTLFCLMRFRLADAWTMRVLQHMKTVADNYAAEMIADMMSDFWQFAALYEKARRPETLFPETYLGRQENQDLAARRAEASRPGKRQFFPVYMPFSNRGAGAATGGAEVDEYDEALALYAETEKEGSWA